MKNQHCHGEKTVFPARKYEAKSQYERHRNSCGSLKILLPELFVPGKSWNKRWWKHFTPASVRSSGWGKQCNSFYCQGFHLQLKQNKNLLCWGNLLLEEHIFNLGDGLKTTTSVSAVVEWWPVYEICSSFANTTCLNNGLHTLHGRSGTDDGKIHAKQCRSVMSENKKRNARE